MKVLIIGGTLRHHNYSGQVAQFVAQVAEQNDTWEVDLLRPQELTWSWEGEGTDAKQPELAQRFAQADAYILVTPEYNHGYPGSLKYLFDLHYDEYKHKPIALVGVSDGAFGGVRAIENWLPVLRTLNLAVLRADVKVPNVDQEIENGTFKHPETWQRRVEQMLTELEWYARTLQWGRENL